MGQAPRLIRHDGKARVTRLRDERTGKTTGFQVETKDGRKGAVVRPDTIRYGVSISGKGRR